MPADHGSRSRAPPSRPHSFSRSPPRVPSGHHRSSDSARGRDKDNHGRSSSNDRRGDTSPSFNAMNKSHESSRPRHTEAASSTNGSGVGRGSSATSSNSARSHFQNLSWTPDKGSRGGVAPSERRLPPPKNSSEMSGVSSASEQLKKPAATGTASVFRSESDTLPPRQDAQNRAATNAQSTSAIKKIQLGKSAEDRKESPVAAATTKAPPTKPAVKFEMKVPTAPALARRTNPIQAAPKAPSRPSVFQTSNGPIDDRHRRPEPPSPRNKLPPSRYSNSRYDDLPPPRRPSYPEDYRREPPPSHRSGYLEPYPPSSHDRRPHDHRPTDSRHRISHTVRDPKSLKSSKPRRKRFRKVLKKHVRVVLPPKALPSQYATSDFIYHPRPDRTSVVGAGTYGKVFKAHNVYLNHCVALKTLPLVKPRRKAVPRDHGARDKKRKRPERWVKDGLHLTSLREIKLLKSISHQHDNVVGIREIFLEGPSCNLVFDYFEFDMHGIIYSAKVALEDAMTKHLVLQVFQGLDFLHTKAHILHRDIKAANILVGVNGQVRITDFGLAKQVKSQAELDSQPWYKTKFENSNRVITTPYRPPELLLGATMYGGEVDVWSGGCVLFEAFLKKLPFQGTGEDFDHLLTIWKILGLPNSKTYPEVTSLEWYWLFMTRVQPKRSIFGRLYENKMTPQLYHLLRCIFQHDPTKRPAAAQILRHPFFTSESPLPKSAGAFLSTVEGEWHELEYKMIRDKEKAATRRKHENNVILGYLKHKQADHEQELSTSILPAEITTHQERIDFYKTEQESFQLRLDAKPSNADDETDHSKQVAEMKKSHGDMYMNAARRGRYRGPTREKVDEKLLQEAWKWYEDENKKGNNPVPALNTETKSNGANDSHVASTESNPVKTTRQPTSLLKSATLSSTAAVHLNEDFKQLRADRKRDYEVRLSKHAKQVARYNASKSRPKSEHHNSTDKRPASSPLIDERDLKRGRDEHHH